MGSKFAGFLKRAKNLGKNIIQGLDWVNDKIIKPVRTVTDPIIGATKYGGIINKGLDWASGLIDDLADKSRGQRQIKGGVPNQIKGGVPKQINSGVNKYGLW